MKIINLHQIINFLRWKITPSPAEHLFKYTNNLLFMVSSIYEVKHLYCRVYLLIIDKRLAKNQ